MIDLLKQYRKTTRQIINVDPQMISWEKPEEKSDGFGGKITIDNSAEIQMTAQVRFAKYMRNLNEISPSPIGFSDETNLYIIMYWFNTIEQGQIIKQIRTGAKYKVGQIEDLSVSGGIWMRRAKVEKVG